MVTFTQGSGTNARLVTEGFVLTKFKSHGQKVYSTGTDWISPDTDGHNGGIWKKRSSYESLGSKKTRDGLMMKTWNE